MKALVAEDEPTSRFILHKIVSLYGQCDTAVDGEEAYEKFLKAMSDDSPYDLIFLDIMMPKQNGLEVLSKIRDYELEQDIPPDQAIKVFMTTALGDEENVFEAHVSGCLRYFVKPLKLSEIREQLVELGFNKLE